MKIYFAGSIRGGRHYADSYLEIIKHLEKYGEVLTEHVGDKNLAVDGEKQSDKYIHDRDLKWVNDADVIIAEVSTPSLGVGYEIGKVEGEKHVLCLYKQQKGKKLSAMIAGSTFISNKIYHSTKEAKNIIDEFFNGLIL